MESWPLAHSISSLRSLPIKLKNQSVPGKVSDFISLFKMGAGGSTAVPQFRVLGVLLPIQQWNEP